MITLPLTIEEAKLVRAALNAEIIKGAGTFLSDTDVTKLGNVLNILSLKAGNLS